MYSLIHQTKNLNDDDSIFPDLFIYKIQNYFDFFTRDITFDYNNDQGKFIFGLNL